MEAFICCAIVSHACFLACTVTLRPNLPLKTLLFSLTNWARSKHCSSVQLGFLVLFFLHCCSLVCGRFESQPTLLLIGQSAVTDIDESRANLPLLLPNWVEMLKVQKLPAWQLILANKYNYHHMNTVQVGRSFHTFCRIILKYSLLFI